MGCRKSVAVIGSLVLLVVACSSSDTTKDAGAASSSGGKGKGDAAAATGSGGKAGPTAGKPGSTPIEDTLPVGKDLSLLFSPMYSAYDGVHDFKVPAIVQGVQGAKWSARPADAVDLEPDSSTGGVMITTRKAGKVLIIARAGKLSGSADLFVTDAKPEDWELGEMRYNNAIPFPMFDGGFPEAGIPDGGMPGSQYSLPDDLQCSNCHGDGAQALDVEHSPQQTGGYSDDDLATIVTMGMKPKGAKFHTPFPPALYARFHTWDATPEELKGIIIYLRSLDPKSQGALDFQGLRDAFGGAPPPMP